MSASVKVVGDQDSNWDRIPPNEDHTVATRMIGVEDVRWDVDGTGEKTSYVDRTNTEREITALNAGHIPLPLAAREACGGAGNVAAGMTALKELIGEGGAGGGQLDGDTAITLGAGLSPSDRQNLIDEQPRNLGNHTLTIEFLEAIDLALTEPLVFAGFYGGALVIDLNGVQISDAAAIGRLFMVRDNYCHVTIRNGTMKHTASTYAIWAERCPALYLDSLEFIASGTADNYALCGLDVDGFIEGCTTVDDKPVTLQSLQLERAALAAATTANGAVSTHNGASDAHAALFNAKAEKSHTHTPAQAGADPAGTAGSAVNTHNTATAPHSGVLAPLANPTFTGTPKAPTAATGTNTTQLATTAFVQNAVTASGQADQTVANHNQSGNAHSGILAPLASPEFNGTPKVPTAASGTDSEQIANTAFVQSAITGNTVITGRITNAVDSHNLAGSAHATLFNAKAEKNHTHTASNVGADPAGTATRAVSDHNALATAHATLFNAKANANHTHTPAQAGAEPTGTAGSAVNAHNASTAAHADLMKLFIPPGVIFPYAGNGGVPSGFLLCDGRAVSRTTYANLFAAIGTLYGAGNGSSTFNIPNFKGAFLRGFLSGTTKDIGTPQPEGLPNITGKTIWSYGSGNDLTSNGCVQYTAEGKDCGDTDRTRLQGVTIDASKSNAIYGASTHVTPVNYAVQYIIRT